MDHSARRRAAAAARSVPLSCSCRDPWTCRHHDEDYAEPLSDREFHAYKATVLHLHAHGMRARFPEHVRLALDAYLRQWWERPT